MGDSLFPSILSEAKTTRFSVSLLLLAGLCYGAFFLGRNTGREVSDARMEALTSVHDRRLEAIAKSLESISTNLVNTNHTLDVIDGRVHQLNGQVEVLKAKIDR